MNCFVLFHLLLAELLWQFTCSPKSRGGSEGCWTRGGSRGCWSRESSRGCWTPPFQNLTKPRIYLSQCTLLVFETTADHETLIPCWCNAGQASQTMVQHYINIGSTAEKIQKNIVWHVYLSFFARDQTVHTGPPRFSVAKKVHFCFTKFSSWILIND